MSCKINEMLRGMQEVYSKGTINGNKINMDVGKVQKKAEKVEKLLQKYEQLQKLKAPTAVRNSEGQTTAASKEQHAAMKVLRELSKVTGTPKIERSKDLLFSMYRRGIDLHVKGQYKPDEHKVTIALQPTKDELGRVVNNEIERHYFDYVGDNISDEELFEHMMNDPMYAKLLDSKNAAVVELDSSIKQLLSEPLVVLTHELVHASARRFMVNNPEHPAVTRINNLYKQALTPRYVSKIDKAMTIDNTIEDYWKKNVDEFLAEALTNPRLMKALNDIKVNEQGKLSSMFKKLYDAIMEILGYTSSDTMYSYVLDGYTAIIEAQANEPVSTVDSVMSKARKLQATLEAVSAPVAAKIIENRKDC